MYEIRTRLRKVRQTNAIVNYLIALIIIRKRLDPHDNNAIDVFIY